MGRRPKTDIRQCASGASFELVWSDDESVVRLAVYSKDGQKKSALMTTHELEELRQFLNERMN